MNLHSFQGNHIWGFRPFKVTQLWWGYPPMHRNRNRSPKNKKILCENGQFSLFVSYIAILTNFWQRQNKNFDIA